MGSRAQCSTQTRYVNVLCTFSYRDSVISCYRDCFGVKYRKLPRLVLGTQGHGTPSESKSPPDGRASGTVRRSVDGGKTWEASVVLNGHQAYSYSCLSKVGLSTTQTFLTFKLKVWLGPTKADGAKC